MTIDKSPLLGVGLNINGLSPSVRPPSDYITSVNDPFLNEHGVELCLLRLDLLHPYISGNKWLKLKGSLEVAKHEKVEQIVSFGGPYSNHLHALAWAGAEFGIKTHAVVRGRPDFIQNPTLQDASRWGMSFSFVSYAAYRRRHDASYLKTLKDVWGSRSMIIPEGGASRYSLSGFSDFLKHFEQELSHANLIALACGTGGTLAGVLAGLPVPCTVMGVPVLKKGSFIEQEVTGLLAAFGVASDDLACPYFLDLDGHYGGYGKVNPELLAFMEHFERRHNIPLEPVYTGKLIKRIYERVAEGRVARGTRMIAIHTGGLQGNRGFNRESFDTCSPV